MNDSSSAHQQFLDPHNEEHKKLIQV